MHSQKKIKKKHICFIWSFLKFCVDPSHEGCWLFCNSLYVNSLTPESIWYVNKRCITWTRNYYGTMYG